jgi:poly-gamma-glutamate synthesis protein (capsule biosynthesis protein)
VVREWRSNDAEDRDVKLFLCGDVMTGRGVDQILSHPSAPRLLEPYVRDARDYVRLAERVNGRIPTPVDDAYVWGAAQDALDRERPDARIVNLETSITTRDEYWPDKGIHYRMHPENIGCLAALRPDVCVLANNHVLDFGHAGLLETIDTLERAGIAIAGAGRDPAGAAAPARIPRAGRDVLVFAVADESSGVPPSWAAAPARPGVDLIADLSERSAAGLADRIAAARRPGDVVVVSIHWGTNWGWEVTDEQRRFARRLVEGGADVVHGHSSHHPRPIERHRGRLILYGCGDFLDDYEGIRGYEEFRDDLVLMYLPTLAPAGELVELRMTPLQLVRMRLTAPSPRDRRWLADTLDRASAPFGTRVVLDGETLVARFG